MSPHKIKTILIGATKCGTVSQSMLVIQNKTYKDGRKIIRCIYLDCGRGCEEPRSERMELVLRHYYYMYHKGPRPAVTSVLLCP